MIAGVTPLPHSDRMVAINLGVAIDSGVGRGDEFGWGADERLRVGARSRHSEGKLGNGVDGRQSENDGWIVDRAKGQRIITAGPHVTRQGQPSGSGVEVP